VWKFRVALYVETFYEADKSASPGGMNLGSCLHQFVPLVIEILLLITFDISR
jgi:hypothetical protein